MSETILPKIPSQLIRLALEDLRTCEAQPDKFDIDMSQWITPYDQGKCAVCLAGAAIAQRLDPSPDTINPHDFPGNEAQLYALDSFRVGNVRAGLRGLGVMLSERVVPDRYVTSYGLSPAKFRDEMEKMASELEAAGY